MTEYKPVTGKQQSTAKGSCESYSFLVDRVLSFLASCMALECCPQRDSGYCASGEDSEEAGRRSEGAGPLEPQGGTALALKRLPPKEALGKNRKPPRHRPVTWPPAAHNADGNRACRHVAQRGGHSKYAGKGGSGHGPLQLLGNQRALKHFAEFQTTSTKAREEKALRPGLLGMDPVVHRGEGDRLGEQIGLGPMLWQW